jgi:integrase/recombinase XerC
MYYSSGHRRGTKEEATVSAARKRRQRGTGAIIPYTTKDGELVLRIQYRDADGRRDKKTVKREPGETDAAYRKRVEILLRDRLNEVKKNGYRVPKPTLFVDYSERWFNESQLPLNWKPATVKTYRYIVTRLQERFGHKRLTDFKRSEINTFAAESLAKGVSARTVNMTLTVLHSILDKAVEEELIPANPAKGLSRPKEPKYKPRPLTVAEARAVEARIEDPFVRLAFLTAELLGLRWSEIRGLRWRHVDMTFHRLRVEDSKTDEGERSLAMPAPLVTEYEKHFERVHYKSDNDYVFHHPDAGTPASPHTYRKLVKKAVEAVGITDRFRPFHDLRVTSLTSGVLANEHRSSSWLAPATLVTRRRSGTSS